MQIKVGDDMTKKKILKIITILALIIILFGSVQVFADVGDPISDPNSWKPIITEEPEITEKAGSVLGILMVIGILLYVISLAVLGIKYMMGSLEERADYKKSLVPYIVGIFLLAMVTSLPNLIYNITKFILKL